MNKHLHLIILMAFALLAFAKPVKAQSYTAVFDISKGNVTFTSDRKYDGYSSNGTHLTGIHYNANKYKITGSVTSVSTNTYDAANGTHGISAVSNPYTVTIETINLVPTSDNGGNGNKGMTYDITLDHLTIDRSAVDNVLTWVYGKNQDTNSTGKPNFGLNANGLGVGNGSQSAQTKCLRYLYESKRALSRPPFDAGDDTVEVILTLVGTNTLKGESGANAALQYHRYDGKENKPASGSGAYTTWLGVLGDKSLTIKGSGSLYVKKDGSQNAGAAIGAACIGTGVSSSTNGHLIFESGTVTAVTGGPGDYSVPLASQLGPYHGIIGHPAQFGSYAAAIGGGACGRCGHIEITGGIVNATSYSSTAAIGCGGGFLSTGGSMTNTIDGVRRDGLIEIKGGTVNTYSMGMMGSVPSVESAVGIGGGSCNYNSGNGAGIPSEGEAGAKIIISGGTVNVKKNARNDGGIEYVGGDIGGGHSNISLSMPSVFEEYWPTLGLTPGYGGDANVKITGGNISAGNIGGGCATHPGTELIDTKGGDALLTIDMTSGLVDLTGYIGGGNSVYKSGGDATVNVIKGTINATSIGGGSSIGDDTASPAVPGDGDGGDATVTVQSGTLTVTGKIGGGYSHGAGAGGNASIVVTGGELDCASIGGGDTGTGTPGAVVGSGGAAGVQISETSPSNPTIVNAGYIGGGKNAAGTSLGRATASISGGSVQGQFILNGTGCSFTMTGGTIDNTDLGAIGDLEYPRLRNEGGAIFMNSSNGTVSISGGTIQNCTGTLGGAIYMTNGTFTLSGTGSIINCKAKDISGSKQDRTDYNGGAVYMGGGTCNIQGGSISYNEATTNGGGIYANAGTTTITKGSIEYNEATNGGGIYANGGTVTIQYASTSDGTINHNFASEKGGGLYIPSNGSLYLKGQTTLEYNHVPVRKQGGGVYLEGMVQAGENSSTTIVVEKNFAGDTYQYDPTNHLNNRNNIYLPIPTDVLDGGVAKDVITVVNAGLNLTNSKIGFSVPHNFVPVIYCSNAEYLSDSIMSSDAVFEDGERYSKYYSTTSPYKPNYIYLSANTWAYAVASNPDAPNAFDYSNINTEEKLAWLISLVNGLHGQTADDFTGKEIKITADLDMKEYSWVPIGMTKDVAGTPTVMPFKGTFNGNGHTISNIYCSYLGNDDTGTGTNLGLFGTVENATIHDVFLKGVELQVLNQSDGSFRMGAIATNVKGTTTIYNCTATSKMESSWKTTTMGGLVAELTSGTIHSSAAMPEMVGYTMGGLAGTNSGNIYNSFANPQFEYSGPAGSTNYYVGGLVAENSGTVQNCYVRFSRASSLGSAKFGQIVGSTSNANVTVCYNPESYSSGISANLVYPESGTVSSTNYGDVVAPYLYNNHDSDNIVYGTSETLCNKLNDWVTTHSGNGYAQWKRTTAGGYSTSPSGGNINGDYPIHEYSGYTCVASTDGINLDYHTSLDNMLARHASSATINLYANEANVTGSTGTNVVVYIDENISLLQDVSGSKSRTSVIEAYTCQTLPGDPRSWHFISSSLSNSGIGFTYGQSATFNWEPNPCLVTINENNDASLFPGDLPKVGGYSDVSRIDLYAFYEPEYHWINLKRKSDSHWHMNATTTPINYHNGVSAGNETTLIPGKGYLVSIDQDQLLQNKGTLNNGDVEVALGYTPAQAWAGLVGYNLLGNPYQSYLSFTAFAAQNSNLWYVDSKGRAVEPTYAVYDDAMGGYIQYKQGASRGARTVPGTMNMHQGFMVRSNGATRAKFTNAMRTNVKGDAEFREEQPAFPLINLTVTDDEGVNDFAVLELGRDADEGAQKLRANDSKGWLYLRHNDDDYGILFRSEVADYQPLWFEAVETGTYTLSWETANAEFESLTLIDNITGVTTNMLTNDSYTFEANPDQYTSRFKIVIGDYKDIEENEGGASTGSVAATFAYYSNGEIHLVETCQGASLQIIDMTGRVILSQDASHASAISTTGMAPGVYVLRLTNGKGTKIQKMVIE